MGAHARSGTPRQARAEPPAVQLACLFFTASYVNVRPAAVSTSSLCAYHRNLGLCRYPRLCSAVKHTRDGDDSFAPSIIHNSTETRRTLVHPVA